ncbi:MAG TPA: hypothetical protein VKA60_22520 [Blastocatellia bacterium]|nr:hypothetical protein [Blastocatellia bacterium]
MKRSPACPRAWRVAIAILVLMLASIASAQAPAEPAANPCAAYEVGGASTPVDLGVDLSVFLKDDKQTAQQLVECAGSLSNVTLFLNGYAMKGIPARYGPAPNQLIFRLEHTDNAATQNAWAALLGGIKKSDPPQPGETDADPYGRVVSVSVGYNDKPLKSTAWTRLHPIRRVTAWVFLAVLLFGLVALIYWARHSGLIRDIGPDPVDDAGNRLYRSRQGKLVTRTVNDEGKAIFKDQDGNIYLPKDVKPVMKTYSLARTQLAFWVVITLASFFFIWLVTTDRQGLPTFVLGILGISSATAVGSTLIDSSRRTGSESDRDAYEAKLTQLQTDLAAATAANDAAKQASINRQITETQAAIKRIDDFKPGVTTGFWKDILSDDTGVTIHRFQIVAWTIVLGIIFTLTVINTLIMPNYDGTLLALMGISSGAYLTLKPTEKQDG